jgi:DNA-binding MurR/RpiR family transcriptional regulator
VVDVELGRVGAHPTALVEPARPEPGAPADHPLQAVMHRIVAADIRAMEETAARLDLRAVASAAEAVAGARRVDICGTGDSALVGAELQAVLHRIGVAAWYWRDVHDGLASAATLEPSDVAIGVSHSGRSRETVEVVAEAASRGARTVALTGFPASPLAEVADLLLVTAVPPTAQRPAAGAARHPQLLVLDLLAVAVARLRRPA